MQQNNEAMTSLLLGGQAVTMGAHSACVQNVWERPGSCIREPRKEKQPCSPDGQGLVWFVPQRLLWGTYSVRLGIVLSGLPSSPHPGEALLGSMSAVAS